MDVEGKVTIIRKDRKAVKVNNVWYQSNFKEIPKTINKDDEVVIKYATKGNFNNITSITSKTMKPVNEKIKPNIFNVKDSTTINNLVMCSKDIFISSEGSITLKEATKQVLESYEQVINKVCSN